MMSTFIDKMAEKMQFLRCENEELESMLKNIARNIQSLKIEQPTKCLFTNGCCCYPVEDCYNCPVHSWNGCVPTTIAEIR